jgi:glycosyltransferase involved in cell wall biosynthesis
VSKILFCGNVVDDKTEYRNPLVSAAGNRFQANVISSLRASGQEVNVKSYVSVPLTMEDRVNLQGYGEGCIVREPGKIGLLQSVLHFLKSLRSGLQEADCLMAYNVNYPWLLLPMMARKRKVKSCLILADYSGKEAVHGCLKKIYARLQLASIRRYDVVVALSANMNSYLNAKQKTIIVEGGITRELWENLAKSDKEKKERKVLLYSGLLSRVTGIEELIRKLECLKDTDAVKLVITGKGDLQEQIEKLASTKSWIEYKGHLPYGEYVRLLKTADIVINPRNMDLPENQCNFPSKILDYLATGAIVVSTRFPGWERFQAHIVFSDLDSIGQVIQEIIDLKDVEFVQKSKKTYEENRRFAEEFIWDKQIRRILNEVLNIE